MVETHQEKGFDNRQPVRGSGCGSATILTFGLVWALFGAGLAQLLTWSLWQTEFDGSLAVPNLRWVIILVFGLAMIVPFVIVNALMRVPRTQQIFRTWWLAAIPAVLLAPARLLGITAEQPAYLFEILALLLFFIGLWAWLHSRGISISGSWRGIWIALAVAGALAFPWVLWGALGSIMDTVLTALVGLLFGAVSGLLITYTLIEGINPAERLITDDHNVWMDGLAALITLLILVTGVFQNSIQWLMAMAVPVLGFAAAALSGYGRGEMKNGRVWLAPAVMIGLGTAWPLLFIDPDELSAVISSGAGELIAWATQAGWLALGLGLAAGIILLILRKPLQNARGGFALAGIAAALLWLGAVVVYFVIGQPGFYGERLFVILNSQADVSSAASMTDYNARRAFVYQTLVDHANTTQAGMRATLDRFGIDYTPYYLVNAMEVRGGPILRMWLESRPEVGRILNNPILRPLPEIPPSPSGNAGPPNAPMWNQTMINVPAVWDQGITGKGVVVGQSDSGVQGDHPQLADSYRGAQTGSNDYNWFDPWYHSNAPRDIGGHGTHTLGTVLGNTVGMAPDAAWIGCVNLARNLGNPALYLDCWQFMLAPFPQGGDPLADGDAALGAMVLNNSWGCPVVEGCDPETFQAAVQALRDAGVFVVVSAGNSGAGGCGTVKDPPAIYDGVYSVGAIDSNGNLAPFSSLGPVTVDGSGRLKPDIAAPGVAVLSSYPNSTYYNASGTSMAGPHVVGVVALMWSANPALIGDIQRTTEILDQSAQPYRGTYPTCIASTGYPNDAVGYGVVDAETAVKLALGQ